jgi:methylmalonyl-CoA carboxyltransferase large subunit
MSPTIEETLAEIQAQLASLAGRLARVEARFAAPEAAPAVPAPAAKPVEPAAEPPAETISEEELLAISAALAAYFGVRVHVRQVRLIGSRAWAQEGRVSIQASHRLH